MVLLPMMQPLEDLPPALLQEACDITAHYGTTQSNTHLATLLSQVGLVSPSNRVVIFDILFPIIPKISAHIPTSTIAALATGILLRAFCPNIEF